MTRVLVTGATGFIGLPLLARLARGDREVHALARQPAARLPGVSWHSVDLGDHHAVGELLDAIAPELLVHLAWCTEHGAFWHAVENVGWVERSLGLLRAFVAGGGRRALIVGTCAEYDWTGGHGALAESAPTLPATLYGIAKDALRRVAEPYATRCGVELCWARLFMPFGPREAPARLIPSVLHALRGGSAIEVGTEQVRDLLYVQDAAAALCALLDSGVTGPVNVASGVGVELGDVVERVAWLIGRQDTRGVRRAGVRPHEPSVLVADISRLRECVGFRPTWQFDDALAATVRWWSHRAFERC